MRPRLLSRGMNRRFRRRSAPAQLPVLQKGKIIMADQSAPPLEDRIQTVLDDYRPTLYLDGGDVELLKVDEQGIAHVRMLGACIDCPISLLTMKLGIQRLLKENFSEIQGVNAVTDVDLSALYHRDD